MKMNIRTSKHRRRYVLGLLLACLTFAGRESSWAQHQPPAAMAGEEVEKTPASGSKQAAEEGPASASKKETESKREFESKKENKDKREFEDKQTSGINDENDNQQAIEPSPKSEHPASGQSPADDSLQAQAEELNAQAKSSKTASLLLTCTLNLTKAAHCINVCSCTNAPSQSTRQKLAIIPGSTRASARCINCTRHLKPMSASLDN